MQAIDAIEDRLGHSPHPAITDLPVGAWAVSGISDVMAIATGDTAYDDCADQHGDRPVRRGRCGGHRAA